MTALHSVGTNVEDRCAVADVYPFLAFPRRWYVSMGSKNTLGILG